jgi:hypothetical protein
MTYHQRVSREAVAAVPGFIKVMCVAVNDCPATCRRKEEAREALLDSGSESFRGNLVYNPEHAPQMSPYSNIVTDLLL